MKSPLAKVGYISIYPFQLKLINVRANELLPQIIISKYYIDGIFKKGRTLMSVQQSPAIDQLNIKNVQFRPKKLKGGNLVNR